MTSAEWDTIRWFKPREFYYHGSLIGAEKIEYWLVKRLDEWREEIGLPVYIHNGWGPRGSHDAKNSYHYIGLAVDCHIPGKNIQQQYELAKLRFNDGGIGVYPNWQPNGGLHVDLGPKRRWACINGQYRGIDGVVTG